MWRVCDAVEAELELAHPERCSEGACSLDSFLDGNERSEDVRARGERDEPRLGGEKREQRVELQADRIRVVCVVREGRRGPELDDRPLASGEALPRPRVRCSLRQRGE